MKILGISKASKQIIASVIVIFSLALLVVIYYLLPLSGELPDDMKQKIVALSNENPDDIDFAKVVTIFIVEKWRSPIREYMRQPLKPFIKTYKKAWNVPEREYQASNIEARLIERILLESKRFTNDEINYVHGFCTRSPHGYLEIQKVVNNKTTKFYLDTWALEYGACIGQFASVGCEIPNSFKGDCI